MRKDDIRQTDDASLARLMDFARRDDPVWSAQELGAILRHQLQAPLTSDLDVTENEALAASIDLCARSDPPIRTFGELLFHPRPPVELLEAVKQFAKSCRVGTAAAMPDEIATMLYILSIVAAMTKCDRRISKMDTIALQHCLTWGLEQTWLDEPTRQLLERGSEAVGAGT
jgi:hypothetical protein